jgi:hypothetical protein
VNGRILIDYYGYQKHHEGLDRRGSTDNNGEKSSEKSTYVKCLPKEKQQENINEMLSREQDLMFMTPILEGFSLKSKLWCKPSSS